MHKNEFRNAPCKIKKIKNITDDSHLVIFTMMLIDPNNFMW